FYAPLISPDSSRAVVVADVQSTPERAPHPVLNLLDLATGERSPLAAEWDRWSHPTTWLPDGNSLLVIADEDGRAPIFSIDVTTGEVSRVTSDDSAYSEVVVSPDGTSAYAVRSSYLFPPEVVALDLASGAVTQ